MTAIEEDLVDFHHPEKGYQVRTAARLVFVDQAVDRRSVSCLDVYLCQDQRTEELHDGLRINSYDLHLDYPADVWRDNQNKSLKVERTEVFRGS